MSKHAANHVGMDFAREQTQVNEPKIQTNMVSFTHNNNTQSFGLGRSKKDEALR